MLKYYSMLNIRPAGKDDEKQVKRILVELDLAYQKQSLKDFWVAKDKEELAGVVQLIKHPEFLFLESLGVIKSKEKQGVASALLKKIFAMADKDIYIYTIIPEFFNKFGFKIINPPPFIPPRDLYGCNDCFPEKCFCMVKPHG